MGTGWVTPGLPRMGRHTEWFTPGLPRMGTGWVTPGLPRIGRHTEWVTPGYRGWVRNGSRLGYRGWVQNGSRLGYRGWVRNGSRLGYRGWVRNGSNMGYRGLNAVGQYGMGHALVNKDEPRLEVCRRQMFGCSRPDLNKDNVKNNGRQDAAEVSD